MSLMLLSMSLLPMLLCFWFTLLLSLLPFFLSTASSASCKLRGVEVGGAAAEAFLAAMRSSRREISAVARPTVSPRLGRDGVFQARQAGPGARDTARYGWRSAVGAHLGLHGVFQIVEFDT